MDNPLIVENGRFYLREGELQGTVELVFRTEDGRARVFPLTSLVARKWCAKLADIIAREN